MSYAFRLHSGRIGGGLLFGAIIYLVVAYILPLVGVDYSLSFFSCFVLGFLIRTNVYYKVQIKW